MNIRGDISRRVLMCRQLYLKRIRTKNGIKIVSPDRLDIGENCHIGENVYLDCRGGVEIGAGSIIANNVKIISYNHEFRDRRMIPYDSRLDLRPVRIGRGCWLGEGVLVAPGSCMGDGSVAGMGTVVVGAVEEDTLVAGNPGRKIRDLNSEGRLFLDGQRGSSFVKILRSVQFRP